MRTYTRGWIVVSLDSGQTVGGWFPVRKELARKDRDERNRSASALGIEARYALARVVVEIEDDE